MADTQPTSTMAEAVLPPSTAAPATEHVPAADTSSKIPEPVVANQSTTTAEEHNAATTSTTGSTAEPVTANGSASQTNANATIENAKDTVVKTAQSAVSAVQNHPTVQAISNGEIVHLIQENFPANAKVGPVAENVKDQAAKTSTEFQNLADARSAPTEPAATGQPLTQYHSMFYTLLSWENPRATGIAFAASVIFIFLARFLNILHYVFKFAYFVLGVTATLEIAGKVLFDNGIASSMRPRKYWTIPKESLERSLDDVEQLLNFFVIESQRILYAENVYATIAVFTAAFLSYWLIKIVPFWGLTLIGTCVVYLVPLIYIKNRDTIDSSVQNVSDMISSQTSQLRDMTMQHASKATESVKGYAGEYSNKAQELMGSRTTEEPTTANGAAAMKQEPASAEPVVKTESAN